jgi:hypothetical protein
MICKPPNNLVLGAEADAWAFGWRSYGDLSRASEPPPRTRHHPDDPVRSQAKGSLSSCWR